MLTTLFYDGMDCDVNLTTFGISDSIGPALHFWYSNLHWLLFCKCNARSCLKYWTSWHGYICRISTNGCNGCIFQKNETVTSVSSILIAMVFGTAIFIQKKFTIQCHFWYLDKHMYLTIVPFRWSYNVYGHIIHTYMMS